MSFVRRQPLRLKERDVITSVFIGPGGALHPLFRAGRGWPGAGGDLNG